jgi:hypothetical protein
VAVLREQGVPAWICGEVTGEAGSDVRLVGSHR